MSRRFGRETRRQFREAWKEVDAAGMDILRAVADRQPVEIVYGKAVVYADKLLTYLSLTGKQTL